MNQSKPFSHNEGVVVNVGCDAKELLHPFALKELVVGNAPCTGIGVSAALRNRVLVIDPADRYDLHLGEFDDRGRLAC